LKFRKKGEVNGRVGGLANDKETGDYRWGSGFRILSPMIDKQNMIPDMPDTRTMPSMAVRTPTARKIEDSVRR
jgi:hypothetical protein